jgi:hypothetical protein
MKYSQVGRFFVADGYLHYDNTGWLGAIMQLLGEVFVTSCVHNWGYGRFEYIGISEHFEEVEEGAEAPIYEILVDGTYDSGTEEHTYAARFRKKED